MAVLKRVIKDLKGLHSPANGIFTATQGDQYDLIYVMLCGARTTPYEGGLFFFTLEPSKMFCKESTIKYPGNPPKVVFYNPFAGYIHENMYTSEMGGKVCLSILGTWDGPSWTAFMTFDTIFQSILGIMDLKGGKFYDGFKTNLNAEALSKKILHETIQRTYAPIICENTLKIGVNNQSDVDFAKFFRVDVARVFLKNYDYYVTRVKAELKHLEGKTGKSIKNTYKEGSDGTGLAVHKIGEIGDPELWKNDLINLERMKAAAEVIVSDRNELKEIIDMVNLGK